MSDETKDFRYYAKQAEHQIQLSLGRDEQDQILVMSDGAKNRHVWRAEIYARLAAAAPPPEARQFELHQADCPCITNR